jgi:hypothetical protein
MKVKYGFLVFLIICAFVTVNAQTDITVGPLIQTQWMRETPFNDMTPFQSDGITRSPVGCGAIAMGQIMKYHNYPRRGIGRSEPYTAQLGGIIVPSVNFNVDYDWDNMLNSYTRANPGTERQRNAVAMLMYHAGVASQMNYGNNQTGSSTGVTHIARGLTTYFGYDRSIQCIDRVWFDNETWENIIRSQLDAGLPVLYMNIGHIFVVDGYDSTGRFHINWGWGGRSNGWFFLDRLESVNSRFNEGHRIVINIKPDEGGIPAPYELAANNFTVSQTSVRQNELFVVSTRLQNKNILEDFPGGQMGVALADLNGRIIDVLRTTRLGPQTGGRTHSSDLSCFIPETINAGQYQLRIVTRIENEDWKFVELSAVGNRIPNTIPITVTAGEVNGGDYSMALTVFTASKTTVSQNESFTVSNRFRNISAEQFSGGQVGVALVDNNNNIVAVIQTTSIGRINSGVSGNERVLDCAVPTTVPPGQYRLRIVIRSTGREWRIATLSLPDIPNSIPFTVR